MKEKKKLKKVSWAPGSKLCQVKLIPKADPPPKVGQKMPNNHPPPKVGPKMPTIPKRRKPSHFPTSCPSAYVPFKKESNVNQLKDKLPQIKWEIPPSFVLESGWLVVSGEESEETKVQKLRETSVPEAVYPHICAIPPSPSIPSDVEEDRGFDDSQTPVIPIIPIEEAESSATSPPKTLPSKSLLPPNPSNDSKPAPVEGDTLLAAVAAATAIMKSMDPGSLIDTNLLVKFLKDPELTLQLINEGRLAAKNVSGPNEDNNTEPGRKTSKVSAPMLTTKPSTTTDTRPSGQPIKTTTGKKDRLGTSGQEPQTIGGSMPGRLLISLPTRSSVDLPSKKFNGAQSQTVNSEMVNLPNPIISPPIVAGSRYELCFTFNPQQKPDSSHIMQTEKAASKPCHQTNAENAVPAIPRPLIHAPEPLVPHRYPLSTSSSRIKHTDNAAIMQLQCHVINTEKAALAIPRPLTHTVGERAYETGLTMPRYPFSNYASRHQEPVGTSGLVTEKQQLLPQPRMTGGSYTNSVDPFGTSSNNGSHVASKPTPVLNSELKDEHGPHDHVTKAHAIRINPTVGNPSQPDLSVFKRMIRDYGLPDNSTESEPLATPKDDSVRPIQQHSSGFGAPAFSAKAANVPQLKYFSYHQFLTKQHGETQNKWDHHRQSPPHTQSSNMLHIHKPKTQETCLYFNSAKGCRNGSTCLFRHEVFDQKRPMATTHEAPDSKRMKLGLGREIIGRT